MTVRIQRLDETGAPTGPITTLPGAVVDFTPFTEAISNGVIPAFQRFAGAVIETTARMTWLDLALLFDTYPVPLVKRFAVEQLGIAESDIARIHSNHIRLHNHRRIDIPETFRAWALPFLETPGGQQ